MDDEQWEKDCKRIRKENAKLLEDFEKSLMATNLTSKTIKKHISNIDFYINRYLLYSDAKEAAKGYNEVDDFLGFWYIRKCIYSTPETTKSNITSFKKFYAYMESIGKISKSDLEDMLYEIKYSKEDWIEQIKNYNDFIYNY